MASAADFNEALRKQGLPPAYRFEAEVHQAQLALPGSLDALEAFRRSLPALFEPCRIDPNREGFAAMVTSQPESFGLTASASGDQIHAVILQGLAADPDLAFHLLPAGEEPQAAEGMRLFPPEQGETVEDYWIWTVRCPAFFPGPAWLLQRRDGQEPPYTYGTL
ncbi:MULTISPECIES: hypothetical protein [Aphanothece]|uniref:hypothetical protein n=1 Tax=Aphanothece TaxID=1121 RepID=UPI003984A9CE